MCGIAGFFFYRDTQNFSPNLSGALESIKHRGPDDDGVFYEPCVGLGHRRLAIVDVSPNGHQPMASHSGQHVIVYNGEIYNFKQLRDQLLQSGFNFKGNSDSEVLVNAISHWGFDVITKLNGIFAFAIWDRKKKTLCLARDRTGVKPLYYLNTGRAIYFGSEIKALKCLVPHQSTIDPQGFHEYLYYGNTLGSTTFDKQIKRLLPGTALKVSTRGVTHNTFWSPSQNVSYENRAKKPHVLADNLRDTIEGSVKQQLMGDVPIGIFLSGGVDSSAITAFAVRNYPGTVNTYSARFDFDNGHSELPMARRIARSLGTNHHELNISADQLSDLIVELMLIHDDPFGDAANIPIYLMTKHVQPHCKVILQGDGGDELFGGYSRYPLWHKRNLYRLLTALSMPFKCLLSKSRALKLERFRDIFFSSGLSDSFARLLTVEVRRGGGPHNILSKDGVEFLKKTNPFQRYEEVFSSLSSCDEDLQKMLLADLSIILPDTFLEKVDRPSMANGVEVRVPLLDNEVVDFCLATTASAKIPAGRQKYLLKMALRGVVPNFVLDAPKKGFGVPYYNWLRGPLRPFLDEVLNDEACRAFPMFDHSAIQACRTRHESGCNYSSFTIWKLLQFFLWYRHFKPSI
jgi:asparagine synthase (glutamine-hydrolysing)